MPDHGSPLRFEMKALCASSAVLLLFAISACGSSHSNGTDAGAGAGGAPDAGTPCELDGGECSAGYRCGCGGPGPRGICTCHKECTNDNECASNETCGCTPTDPAPRICVNACFCVCG